MLLDRLNLNASMEESMSSINILFATLLIASVTGFAAEPKLVEKETYVSFSDFYIQKSRGVIEPHELLVSGVFPNGCYQWVKAEVNHPDQYTHEVRGVANVAQSICIMVLVPFTKEVDLGVLKQGTHTVRVMNGDGTVIEKQFDL